MNALTRLLPLALLLLLGSCRLFHTPSPAETLVAATGQIGPADDVEWKVATQGTARWHTALVIEHLPEQAAGRRSRVFSHEFIEGFSGTAEQFVEGEMARLSDLHQSFYWSWDDGGPAAGIYQWAIRGPSDLPDQSHLCRALVGVDGLHRADYKRMGAHFAPDERKDWGRHLTSLRLVARESGATE